MTVVQVAGRAVVNGVAQTTTASLTIAPGPPPPSGPVYGISAGDNIAASQKLVGAKRIRGYSHQNLLDAISLGMTDFFHSMKVTAGMLGKRDAATMTAVRNEFHLVPRGRVAFNHEQDNNTTFGSAAHIADAKIYQGDWLVYLEIIAAENATRTAANRLITCPTTTGVLYKKGDPNLWYVAGADEIGTDIYDPSVIPLAAGFALTKGKPWSIPETGYKAGTADTDAGKLASDPVMLARAKSDQAVRLALPHPPSSVWAFNNNDSEIQNRPLTAAFWAGLM